MPSGQGMSWRWIQEVRGRRKAPWCEFCGLKKVGLGRKGLRIVELRVSSSTIEVEQTYVSTRSHNLPIRIWDRYHLRTGTCTHMGLFPCAHMCMVCISLVPKWRICLFQYGSWLIATVRVWALICYVHLPVRKWALPVSVQAPTIGCARARSCMGNARLRMGNARSCMGNARSVKRR